MSSLLEVDGWVEKLMECNLLPETDIISLCKKAKEVTVITQASMTSRRDSKEDRVLLKIMKISWLDGGRGYESILWDTA